MRKENPKGLDGPTEEIDEALKALSKAIDDYWKKPDVGERKPRLDFAIVHNVNSVGTHQTEEIEPGMGRMYIQEH
ncbi:hypothetical protein ACFLTA_04890 [Bacteroidota bacterium]